MKKAIGLSLGVAAAAGAAMWLQPTPAPTPVAAQPAAPPVITPAPAAPPPAPEVDRDTGCGFQPGQRLAYQYALDSKSELEVSELAGQPMTPLAATNRVRARVELEVLRADAKSAVLVGEYRDLSATSDLSPAEMTPAFLVEIDQACALTRFARATPTPRHAARAQQALLWEANWAAGTTTLESADGTGAYTATLTPEPGGAVTRRLERYRDVWGQRGTSVEAEGRLVVHPGAGPWLASADGTLSVELGTQRRSAHLTLARVAPATVRVAPVREADFIWEDLLPVDTLPRATRPVTPQDRARRAAVAPLSLPAALETLTSKAAQQAGLEQQWPELAAWLEVHPEQTAQVVKELREERLPVPAVDGLFVALGNARTPQARDELLALKRDLGAPPPIRMRAMFALVDREDVGAELAREYATDAQALDSAPTRTERFLGAEALLALTTMSGLQARADVTEVARTAVRTALGSAQASPRTRKVALKALGNLGDASLLPLAEPASRDGDWKVREAAAYAFRRVPVADAEAMALAWLAREPHELVKRRLVRTLEVQHFMQHAKTSEALSRQAIRELEAQPNLMARKALIRLLGRSAVPHDPAVRAALVKQARLENQKGSGLLNEVSRYLTPEEIREVLR